MILRNDDVCAGTTLDEIRTFCELCDRYGVTPMHAITPIGKVRSIDCRWSNAEIRERSGTALFAENTPVVEYLRTRRSDHFAVHGLWHTHEPGTEEIDAAFILIRAALWDQVRVEYFVPPFNEGEYGDFAGEGYGENLLVCARIPRLEEYLEAGDPQSDLTYLHSWRFEHGPFRWDQLDACLNRLTAH